MKKAIAEFIGTFALVFIGCGTVVVGGMASGPTAITELAIALAFGLSIVAMAYGIGQISGCHLNPAVSFGVYTAGRMTLEELLTYCVAQVAGAIAAARIPSIVRCSLPNRGARVGTLLARSTILPGRRLTKCRLRSAPLKAIIQ